MPACRTIPAPATRKRNWRAHSVGAWRNWRGNCSTGARHEFSDTRVACRPVRPGRAVRVLVPARRLARAGVVRRPAAVARGIQLEWRAEAGVLGGPVLARVVLARGDGGLVAAG